MSDSIQAYSSSDFFFYYGQGDLLEESKHDLWELLIQPRKSFFYNRQEGGGVSDYENYPNAISLQVGLRLSIASAVAYRNSLVTDNFTGKDRRIAVSQNYIYFSSDGLGQLDIEIQFFMYSDYKNRQKINTSIGGFNVV